MQKPRWQVYNPSIKQYLLFVIIILGGQTTAQNVTFKKRIDNGLDNFGLSLIELDSSYIVVGRGKPINGNGSKFIKLFKTDLQGNVIDFAEYGETSLTWEPGREGSVTATYDGYYVVAGVRVLPTTIQGLLVKFDANLDTLWTQVFPATDNLLFYQCRATIDSSLVIIGSSSDNDPNANIIMIKTDNLGNEIWRKEYGGPYRDIGWTVELTPDGGFIIGGDSYQDATLDSRIGYLIKTDSLGNIEWDLEIGSGFSDGTFNANVISDSDYVVWGGLDTLNIIPTIPYVAKLDINGSTVWRNLFIQNPQKNSYITQVKELSNGNIISVGETRNNDLPYSIGWIIQQSPLGAVLWERFYYWNIDSVMPISFTDFIETSDGGLLVTGDAGSWDNFGIVRTQFLLMKLDSNGCLVNDCGLFTGIEEYVPKEKVNVKMYPNPNTGNMALQYTLAGDGKATFITYDLYGRKVSETEMSSGAQTVEISNGNLSNGVYIYQVVQDGREKFKGKFVILKQ